MLGDSAVCVHPTDERYTHLVGKHVLIPLTGRAIPIIADGLLAKKDLGTGCVKVTPAHDHNDYACGLRNDLEQINILNHDATINENGAQYEGLDRYACREKVVEDMKELGHFVEVEDRKIELAHSDRSKTPVEPYLSDQWFVKMDELAQGAIDAVKDRRVRFYPQRYQSTYLDWLGEKRDWCISRQLWWGHRIPVWSKTTPASDRLGLLAELNADRVNEDGTVVFHSTEVGEAEFGYPSCLSAVVVPGIEEGTETTLLCIDAGQRQIEQLFEDRGFTQDEDVLDTWFSSALWPHATLGWPDDTCDPPLALSTPLCDHHIGSHVLGLVPPSICREYGVLPVWSSGDSLWVVFSDTIQSEIADKLRFIFNFEIVPFCRPGAEVEQAIDHFHGKEVESVDSGVASSDTLGPSSGSEEVTHSPLAPHPSPRNEVLPYFYPGNVLITSRDIITLWVARMVLTGLYNMGDVPFAHVHVHPKILDGFGQTMSKSKGNGCDPQDLIDRYGTDAVRFTISSFAGETQDVKLPMGYECPHCQTVIPQALDDGGPMVKPATVKQSLRGSKDRILMPCPKCKNESQFSTPQYNLDPDQPAARMVSDRFEYGRNFCNKLWNAARFAIMNLEGYTPGEITESDLHLEDHWILSRLSRVAGEVTTLLGRYQFDQATRAIRDFTWNEFCDWYLEMIKPRLRGEGQGTRDEGQENVPSPPEGGEGGRRPDEGGTADDAAADSSSDSPSPALRAPSPPQGGEGTEQGEVRASAQRVLVGVLDNLVRLLQPFTPFICEELWQTLNDIAPERGLFKPEASAESVMIAPWPELEKSLQNESLEARFARLQETVVAVRNIRAVYNISPAEPIELFMKCESDIASELQACSGQFENLARTVLSAAGAEVSRPTASASFSLKDADGFVPLGGLIDVEEELARQQKEADKIRGFIKGHSAKLSNEKFVSKAPEHVVAEVRETLANLEKQLESVETVISQLSGG
jgi:valyl-tRNA synthetase